MGTLSVEVRTEVLCGRICDLEAENAKLRELVVGLWWCSEDGNKAHCENCPLGEVEGHPFMLVCEEMMRDLEIDVEA